MDHLMFKAWRESQGQPEDSEPRKGKWNECSKDSSSQAKAGNDGVSSHGTPQATQIQED